MVTVCLGLSHEELGILGVSCFYSCLRMHLLAQLHESEVASIENLALFATLLLLDVVGVGVTEQTKNAEAK